MTRSEAIANITTKSVNFTTKDVFLTSLVIENLTDEAIINPLVSDPFPKTLNSIIIIIFQIRANYLRAIDNLQLVNRDVILASGMNNLSSLRYNIHRLMTDFDTAPHVQITRKLGKLFGQG